MIEVPSKFFETVSKYRMSVAAYRDFFEQMEAHLEKRAESEEEDYRRLLSPVIADLNSTDRTHLRDLLSRSMTAVSENLKNRDALWVELRQVLSGEEAAKLWPSFLKVVQAASGHTPVQMHRDLLYRGILTGLVGQFEVLVADLAHEFYERAPYAVGTDEKILSVSDLRRFSSIGEALAYVASNKVDDLLRGSVYDWQKFFQTRMKVDLADVTPDWLRFTEFIQRRHLIVHADGKISRRYLETVPEPLLKEYFGQPVLGARATLTRKYVTDCIDAFEVTGLRLGYECWSKLRPDEMVLLDHDVHQQLYALVLSGRWASARALALWASEMSEAPSSSRMIWRVNYWLSVKNLGRWVEVADEVKKFDCSALQPVFALARAALLDDADDFFGTLNNSVAVQLDQSAWSEWPLFSGMRSDERFQRLRERYSTEFAPISPNGDQPVDD